MDSAVIIVSKLNEILESDLFIRDEVDSLVQQLKMQYGTKLKLLDFKYFDERKLRAIKKKKIKYVKMQDFKSAAEYRDLEKECQSYIMIRMEYKIERSTFYYDQEYLFYFHLGNVKNDKQFKKFFNIKKKSYE